MPRWCLRPGSTTAAARRNCSTKARCPRTGSLPSGARKTSTPPGRKKHGKSSFGYKLSINVDKKHKFIRKIETDTASTHDGQHFDKVLDTHNTSRDVYADRGYPSEQREAWLKANGFRNQIQRKGARNKPLSECQQRRNQRIARTRARVEHPFAAIAQMGGKLIRTIGQVRANFAMTMMAACYNLKRLVYFQEAGIEAT